jgi:uncharacterized membrane protein
MFSYIQWTNHVLLLINLVFLMGIVLQPFSTALLAEHIGSSTVRIAALVYYGTLLFTSLAYNALWWYAIAWKLVADDTDPRLVKALTREHAIAPTLHAAAFAVAFWSVWLSFIPLCLTYIFFALTRVSERWVPERDR